MLTGSFDNFFAAFYTNSHKCMTTRGAYLSKVIHLLRMLELISESFHTPGGVMLPMKSTEDCRRLPASAGIYREFLGPLGSARKKQCLKLGLGGVKRWKNNQ